MTDVSFIRQNRLLQMLSRREFFSRLGTGAGAMAIAALLQEQAEAETAGILPKYSVAPRPSHFAPKAKRVIYLFQNGGPSQVDLFDPKPELNKREGQKPGADYVNDVDAKKTGVWLGSPFKFVRHGKSGLELTE